MKNRRTFIKTIGATFASLAASRTGGSAPSVQSSVRKKGPNIILIVSDEHQANTCGCYGSKVKQVNGESPTPHIDALAKEGVQFDSMYCPSPLCAPSRAAYMTGMYPHTTTALYHKMQTREAGLTRFPGVKEEIPGMGQYFRDGGYATAAYGKMHVHGEEVNGWDLGFDERGLRFYTKAPGMHYADIKDGDVNRRYREMEPYLFSEYKKIDPKKFANAPSGLTVKQNGVNEHFLETLVEHEDEMIDPLVTDRSIDFIERKVSANEPFLVHVGLEKPHRPWTIHKKYLDRFNPDEIPLPKTTAEWIDKGMFPFCQGWSHSGTKGKAAQNSTAAYYACASQIDDCVGRIMNKCRELDILDNTIIVYTSDHGENLYEHGLIEKHNMLDPAARIPFIISAPWMLPQGEVCNAPVNLIDLIPTLCEMTSITGSDSLEGVSLLSAITHREDPERMVFSEFYQSGSSTRSSEFLPVRMGLNKEYKYIYTHAAAAQVYRRNSADEENGTNQAFDPNNEALVSHLKLCTLDQWELDEYPMLSGIIEIKEQGVSISWESFQTNAHYDIYRSHNDDPRKAIRVAKGIEECNWIDNSAHEGTVYWYWVLGNSQLDKPYIDPRGKSRYGDQLIISSHYPRSLPITRAMKVLNQNGFRKTYDYEPLLACQFENMSWIYIGLKPMPLEEKTTLKGPVTVLSLKPEKANFTFSAELKTLRPGPNNKETIHLVFNYLNMHQYYSIFIGRDGSIVLSKRTGEWTFKDIASRKPAGLDFNEWNRVDVRFENKVIQLKLNGNDLLSFQDPEPYLEGRIGFDLPLHVGAAEVRSIKRIW